MLTPTEPDAPTQPVDAEKLAQDDEEEQQELSSENPIEEEPVQAEPEPVQAPQAVEEEGNEWETEITNLKAETEKRLKAIEDKVNQQKVKPKTRKPEPPPVVDPPLSRREQLRKERRRHVRLW